MKEGELSQMCEGREETPVCYCTVQGIAGQLHDALESSTPGLPLFLSFNFIFSTVQSTRQPGMLILPHGSMEVPKIPSQWLPLDEFYWMDDKPAL